MYDHHRKAIDELVAQVAAEDRFQAVILSGSIARGTARESSDLDVYLVVPEDEDVERRARHDRTREHGALANPGGRPNRINAA